MMIEQAHAADVVEGETVAAASPAAPAPAPEKVFGDGIFEEEPQQSGQPGA